MNKSRQNKKHFFLRFHRGIHIIVLFALFICEYEYVVKRQEKRGVSCGFLLGYACIHIYFRFVMYVGVNEQAYVSSICFCCSFTPSLSLLRFMQKTVKRSKKNLHYAIRLDPSFFSFFFLHSFIVHPLLVCATIYAKAKHTMPFFERRAAKSIYRFFLSLHLLLLHFFCLELNKKNLEYRRQYTTAKLFNTRCHYYMFCFIFLFITFTKFSFSIYYESSRLTIINDE
jgi:hypothetical protein